MVYCKKVNKNLNKETAKKDKNCRLCNSAWLTGQDMYIMKDLPPANTFELICISCGDQLLSDDNKLDEKSNLNNLINRFEQLLGELKNYGNNL